MPLLWTKWLAAGNKRYLPIDCRYQVPNAIFDSGATTSRSVTPERRRLFHELLQICQCLPSLHSTRREIARLVHVEKESQPLRTRCIHGRSPESLSELAIRSLKTLIPMRRSHGECFLSSLCAGMLEWTQGLKLQASFFAAIIRICLLSSLDARMRKTSKKK